MGKPRKHLERLKAADQDDDSDDDGDGTTTALLDDPTPTYIPDPDEAVWTIKLYRRVNSEKSASGTWNLVHTYHGECWTAWHPDHPVDRVRRQWKDGEYRFDVLYMSKPVQFDDYPGMKGPRIFYVEAEPEREQPQQPQQPHHSTSSQTDVVTQKLLEHALGQRSQPAGQATFQDPWPQISALQNALAEVKGELAAARAARDAEKERANEARLQAAEKRAEERAEAAEKRAEEKAAIAQERAQLHEKVSKLESRLEAVEKRDPVKDIQKFKELGSALGMESAGMTGAVKEGLSVIREAIGSQAASQPQLTTAAKNAAGGSNGQQPQKQEEPHWMTYENGAYKRLGEFVQWVGQHLIDRHELSTEHLCLEASARLSGNAQDVAWLCKCSSADVQQLFGAVWGEDHELMKYWDSHIAARVADFLQAFPAVIANQLTDKKMQLPEFLVDSLREKGHLPKPKPTRAAPADAQPTNDDRVIDATAAPVNSDQPAAATGQPATQPADAGGNGSAAGDAGAVSGSDRDAGAQGGS